MSDTAACADKLSGVYTILALSTRCKVLCISAIIRKSAECRQFYKILYVRVGECSAYCHVNLSLT